MHVVKGLKLSLCVYNQSDIVMGQKIRKTPKKQKQFKFSEAK